METSSLDYQHFESIHFKALRDDNDIDEDEVIGQISDEDPMSPHRSLCSTSDDIMN